MAPKGSHRRHKGNRSAAVKASKDDDDHRTAERMDDGWYEVSMDVDKSKFFDEQYALLEGDIVIPDDADLLRRGERCVISIRRNVPKLYEALIPASMADKRRKQGLPSSTGWLRHELYGLVATLRLPLLVPGERSVALDPQQRQRQQQQHTIIATSHNKRGIKSFNFAGEFVGIFDLDNLEEEEDNDDTDDDKEDRYASYTADKEDILTIKQSELQERMTRHKHFARWLVDTFGAEVLASGSGILDVAGGNGKLSAELVKRWNIPCTIVDPNASSTNCTAAATVKDVTVIAEPLEGDGSDLTADSHPHAERIRNCSVLVGLHPDQATEAMVDMALRLGKPFAVIPCCVMTKLFPNRRQAHTGDPVRTVFALCRYLLDKPSTNIALTNNGGGGGGGRNTTTTQFEVDFLPFAGRNKVLFWRGGPRHSIPLYCQEIS